MEIETYALNVQVQPGCGAQRSNVGCNPLLGGDAIRCIDTKI